MKEIAAGFVAKDTERINELTQRLLQRRIAGEIDPAEYLQLLAEIEHLSPATSRESRRADDSRAAASQRRRAVHDSIGDVPTSGVELQAATEIGKYRLAEWLGAGGMGEVWKAWDGNRDVVLKFLPQQLQTSPEEIARVKDTFLRIHGLQHQHICPTYDVSEAPDAGVFLVMKFIDGQTLSSYRHAYTRQHGGFPIAEVVRLLRPVATALDYAHSMKVVHRDINMAPEQASGRTKDVGAQADVYALGATFYELLTGRPDFAGKTTGETLVQVQTKDPVAPTRFRGNLPRDAETICLNCLEKQPSRMRLPGTMG